MLSGTGGPAGSDLGHVKFVHDIELASGMASQQARESRHEAGPDDHRHLVITGLLIELEQTPNLTDFIGRRDRRHPSMNGASSQIHLTAVRGGDDDHVDIGPEVAAPADLSPVTKRLDDALDPLVTRIANLDHFESATEAELSRHPRAGRASTEHNRSHSIKRPVWSPSAEIVATEFPPAAGLGRYSAAASHPQRGRDRHARADGNDRPQSSSHDASRRVDRP
jgi:hypothetical protein